MSRSRRIVLCDHSENRIRVLGGFLERDPGIEVVGAYSAVEAMLSKVAEVAPDLIALDLETAGADVPAAIEQVMREGSTPILILPGDRDAEDERVIEALAAGAIDAIAADKLRLDEPDSLWAVALRSRIKRLANVRLKHNGADSRPVGRAPSRAWRQSAATYRAVGIGASVGGPPALESVLRGLPADFPIPILVVQHMAAGFDDGLARWLNRAVPPPVALAEDGIPLRPGIWLAPDGAHLRLERDMSLSLDRETEHGVHRPAVDVLLDSIAMSLGKRGVGIVLTGMGRDGAEGIGAVAAAGGLTIAQDEETSAVFGMPGAAIESGVDFVLSLEELAVKLATLRARSAAK